MNEPVRWSGFGVSQRVELRRGRGPRTEDRLETMIRIPITDEPNGRRWTVDGEPPKALPPYFLHTSGLTRISIGRISSRPMIISDESSHLLRAGSPR